MKENKWIIILSTLLVGLVIFLYWQDAKAKEKEEWRKQDAELDAIQDNIDSIQMEGRMLKKRSELEIERIILESN